jgi:hypothetical protein
MPTAMPQARRLSLSRFSRWKWRIKSVLEDTDHDSARDVDLGRALLPIQETSSCAMDNVVRPFSLITPLRC